MNDLLSFPGNYAALKTIQSRDFKNQGVTVAMHFIIVNDDKAD